MAPPVDDSFSSFSSSLSPPRSPPRELRELAEIHQSDGNYAGARFCLASIAEHYISAKDWISESSHAQSAQHYKIRTTIGGIINTFFVQFPDSSSVADEGGLGYLNYFRKVVEKEEGYGDPMVLYTIRIILCYCSQALQNQDLDWLCKLHRQVLSIAEPVYGSNNPDIIHLLRSTAQAIEMQEERKARSWGSVYLVHRMDLRVTRWKYEAEALLLRALSGLQELHGPSSPLSIDCAYQMAMLFKTTHEFDKAESTLREIYETAKGVFGEEHDHTICFLAALSETVLRKTPEDAGLMVHQYITKHRQALYDELGNALIAEEVGKYTPGRGWRDMVRLNDRLSRHLTPVDLRWADHYLYTLPIGDVELLPVSPSEGKKNETWNFSNEAGL